MYQIYTGNKEAASAFRIWEHIYICVCVCVCVCACARAKP